MMNRIILTLIGGGLILTGQTACVSTHDRPVANLKADKTSTQRQFSEKHGERVNLALAALNANDYAAAADILQTVLQLSDLSPYERSTAAQMLGSARYEQNDFSGAIAAFAASIAAGGLLPKEKSNMDLNIAQLLIASDKPAQGAQRLEDWIADGNKPKQKHIEYLWQAWSQAGRYGRALPWAERWFHAADPKQRTHYNTLNFLYTQLGKRDERQVILQEMAQRWPKDESIKQALTELNTTK